MSAPTYTVEIIGRCGTPVERWEFRSHYLACRKYADVRSQERSKPLRRRRHIRVTGPNVDVDNPDGFTGPERRIVETVTGRAG